VEETWEFAVVSKERPAVPMEIYWRLREEAGYRCAVPQCNATGPFDMEHIVPWHKCKNHDFFNMILLCKNCHGKVSEKKERGKICKESLKTYKRNLAIISGRYTLYEMRMMKCFFDYEEFSNTYKESMPSEKIKPTNSIMPNTFASSGHDTHDRYDFFELTRSELINIQGLISDEFVNIRRKETSPDESLQYRRYQLSIRDIYHVYPTDNGRKFIANLYAGEEIE